MESETWEYSFCQELSRIVQRNTASPFVIGIVAPPGMGKTISSHFIQQRLQEILYDPNTQLDKQDIVKIVPMDGFHYYKHELDAMPNPDEMHFRRGAHFTFNSSKLYSKLHSLKSGQIVSFPTFSHTAGDPEEDKILINPSSTKVVIMEGLYLYLEQDVWRDLRQLIDYKIYISGNLDAAMERVYIRNLECIGYSPEITRKRIEENDRLNGLVVMSSSCYADKVVEFEEKDKSMLTRFE